jgi:hypothetical protein
MTTRATLKDQILERSASIPSSILGTDSGWSYWYYGIRWSDGRPFFILGGSGPWNPGLLYSTFETSRIKLEVMLESPGTNQGLEVRMNYAVWRPT